ncbi:hypothetical protein SCLCIDRAFT_1212469 [Scleroderma citrinum Foug A]|uniref:Protein kinase domain-containing protein n=1 Tax=Scleroderma citrinum Foug A TaxID=1036808 RepID=A0A0C3EBF8_9AGAM|nr:hypothetical protein SCLCIDRAFT_1212469 [Scleroderma citrinum Foug A]
MSSSFEGDTDSISSNSSSAISLDDDQTNSRIDPHWSKYRNIFECHGYHLETVRDVKDYYRDYDVESYRMSPAYRRACALQDDNALCKDPGLPSNLFRATCHDSSAKLIVKAVHLLSRERSIARYMSSSVLRRDPMNHCIPILGLLDVPSDGLCFIIMEEWSPHLLSRLPTCLVEFLSAIQQCIEHIVFMHKYNIVHLDISVHNFVTDYYGHYACIDYELSRRLDIDDSHDVSPRGTEIPPELGHGQSSNLFAIDIWALAMLILRACDMTGFQVPGLIQLTRPMLNESPDKRPSALAVLREFHLIYSSYMS